jgi:hypothetical protein
LVFGLLRFPNVFIVIVDNFYSMVAAYILNQSQGHGLSIHATNQKFEMSKMNLIFGSC